MKRGGRFSSVTIQETQTASFDLDRRQKSSGDANLNVAPTALPNPNFHSSAEDRREAQSGARRRRDALPARLARWCLLAVAAVFFAFHFVHLSADFPNHSPWMDWSKYTDEGWYGDGAIRQIQLGHWYLRGDFNPAAALPVWPLLEWCLFSFTGVSLIAARALSVSVFGATLLVAYLLMRRCSITGRTGADGYFAVAPSAGVALLAASPFCYAFTRLAILEPSLVLLGMLALLAATAERRWLATMSLGVLLPAMILTKTTAVFLVPSIAWMLWAASGHRIIRFFRIGIPAAIVAAAIWAGYFYLVVKPRFLEDYRYLFSANAYTGITRENAWEVVATTVRDGIWMGKLTYPAALLAMFVAVIYCRRLFRNPLIPSLMFWAFGYAGFLAYHNNLQPRYYLVIAVPLTMLPVIVAEEIYFAAPGWLTPALPIARGTFIAIAGVALAVILAVNALQTAKFIGQPEYTFLDAAKRLKGVVESDKTARNDLVLSISGSDLSLMTGLPSICDDFGTMALEDRVAAYKPGWYATWNQVDDDKMDALAPMYHLQRVAAFPAFDDPERNLLILYRLDPPVDEVPRRKQHKLVPKRLQTELGQQPSTIQLAH
jgi:hypothetical protein